jgi:hypothetical protein
MTDHESVYYACDGSSIRKLVPDDGDEGGCDASIAKTGMTFGSNLAKSFQEMYISSESNSDFKVTAISENNYGQVTVSDDLTNQHVMKAHMPRGVKGSYLGFNIQNVDGKWFSISDIELLIAMARRNR